jgi:hypothetical protein
MMPAKEPYELPLDVIEKIEQIKTATMENAEDQFEWTIFRSRYEDSMWIIHRIFEDEDEKDFQIVASRIAYQTPYYTRST